MMAVSLGMLAQLSVSFCHTYEAEIQPWCTRQAPPLTPLGPLCKRIHGLKAEIDKVCGDAEISLPAGISQYSSVLYSIKSQASIRAGQTPN